MQACVASHWVYVIGVKHKGQTEKGNERWKPEEEIVDQHCHAENRLCSH